MGRGDRRSSWKTRRHAAKRKHKVRLKRQRAEKKLGGSAG